MNTTTKIKICGITNIEDAQKAIEFNIFALGMIFTKSPRQITIEKAKEIAAVIPANIKKIGVFANDNIDNINSMIDLLSLDYVQLHGSEAPEFCSKLKIPVIKAIPIADKCSLDKIKEFNYNIFAFLLDTYSPDKLGGTGNTFDWTLLSDLGLYTDKHIILAGGLNIDNIEKAIRTVNPYGVDINSGIETEPGLKDHDKLREIIAKIRA